jgi:DNA-directed RNA polymerase specialized sigma24 family protein
MPYAGRICGAIALGAGDDALQETMIAVVQNLGSLREPAAARGWVRRIAVREAVRVARHPKLPVEPDRVERAGSGGERSIVRAVRSPFDSARRGIAVVRLNDVRTLDLSRWSSARGCSRG